MKTEKQRQDRKYYLANRGRLMAQSAAWYSKNWKRKSETQRQWNKRNKQRRFENLKRWRKKNKQKLLEYGRSLYKKNKSRVLLRQRLFWKSDPLLRLRNGLANRIRKGIKAQVGSKSYKTLELLGCSVLEARAHLRGLFRPGMTWKNHGRVWHIDHKRPCASFDLTKSSQQKLCFHWTNLQPLFKLENLAKGDKY